MFGGGGVLLKGIKMRCLQMGERNISSEELLCKKAGEKNMHWHLKGKSGTSSDPLTAHFF